jgi:hypothetical protein
MHDRVSRLWHIAVWFTVISCYFSSVMKSMHVYEMLYNTARAGNRKLSITCPGRTLYRVLRGDSRDIDFDSACTTFSSHLRFERQSVNTPRTTTSLRTLDRPSILAKAASCPKGEEDDTMVLRLTHPEAIQQTFVMTRIQQQVGFTFV